MLNKIKSREYLKNFVDRLKKEGKTIGFTSGCFDILHAGHIDYLEKAKEKCDFLIVGVNSDESVKKYKSSERPIVSEKQRLKVMAGIESVDYVFIFDERRNKDNIEILKPDIYFKAGDYNKEELTSAIYLKQWGGKVIIIPIEEDISTSKIIDKIKNVI